MRLRFRGGIYPSRKVCGCGGCPGGYGIRPGCLRQRKVDAERLPVYFAGL